MVFADISGVSSDALSLVNLLNSVLARTVASYTAHNAPVPARQYWMMGTTAVDGEQLCVSFIQAYLGRPGDEAHEPIRGESVRSAVLTIAVSRLVPISSNNGKDAPPAADMQSAAKISAVDSWILLNLASSLDTWDPDASPNTYGIGVIATLEAPVQEGGYTTVNLTVTMVIP